MFVCFCNLVRYRFYRNIIIIIIFKLPGVPLLLPILTIWQLKIHTTDFRTMFVCFCNLFRYSSFYRNIIIIIILKLPGLQLFLLLSWFGFRETGKKLIYVCCQPYTNKKLANSVQKHYWFLDSACKVIQNPLQSATVWNMIQIPNGVRSNVKFLTVWTMIKAPTVCEAL